MFSKLRKSFLSFNMVITSLLMVVAFSAIFFTTHSIVKKENEEIVRSLAEQPEVTIGADIDPLDAELQEKKLTTDSSGEPQTSLSTVHFSVELDKNGEIDEIHSVYRVSDDFAEAATEKALKDGKEAGTFVLDGMVWQYVVTDVESDQIFGSQIRPTEGSQIVFLDVTESYGALKSLLLTLIIIGAIVLVGIYIISRIFAKRAIKPIEESWERQKQFVSDASHELKTPLAIINANYDALMANEDETIKSQSKWLDNIKVGSDRMTHLVGDMLTLTKMEEGAVHMNESQFSLSNSVTIVANSMELLMKEKNITFMSFVEPNIVLNSDEEKVKQLLTILFDNAVKYVDRGGWLKVNLTQEKNQTIFAISNSGPGIPSADLNKVFDRFYRTDKSRALQNRGHGLGLSIAKSISDQLDGKITVDSVENKATIFTFIMNK